MFKIKNVLQFMPTCAIPYYILLVSEMGVPFSSKEIA